MSLIVFPCFCSLGSIFPVQPGTEMPPPATLREVSSWAKVEGIRIRIAIAEPKKRIWIPFIRLNHTARMRSMKAIVTMLLAGGVVYAQMAQKPFSVVEATISDMRAAMEQKRITSRELVNLYLIRIAIYDHRLHSAITINPNALKEAEQLHRDRPQANSP